jgi:hypothetical protein
MKPLMNVRKRPQLALLFSALLVLFCRGPLSKADTFGPGCMVYINYLENGELRGRDDQYSCPITCPDGSTVTGEGEEGDKYADVQADGLKKCSAPAATVTPTATAAPQDTSTPTATATLPPLVSGDVKACSVIEHYINFPLASAAKDLAGHTLEVTWNDAPVQCEVPASNKNVLSCVLPRNVQLFPAQISIRIDGQLTDSFTYDGGGCVTTAPTRNDPPPNGIPVCTGVPPYPEGCTPP